MKAGRARFMVDIPGGQISRRIILTPEAAIRRDMIALKINRSLNLTAASAQRLEKKGVIFSASEALQDNTISPSNIAYDRVLPDRKPLIIDPPVPRTAGDYFLDYLKNRRLDENFVKKFPLLSAFLDESRTRDYFGDRKRIDETEVAEILAEAGASEIALCAGLYYHRDFTSDDNFLRDVMLSGLRLGIDRCVLKSGIAKVKKMMDEVCRAEALNLIGIIKYDVHRANYFAVNLDKEQAVNLINIIRSVLKSRDSKMVYAARNLNHLRKEAEEKYRQSLEEEGREFYGEPGPKADDPAEFFSERILDETALRIGYFLQVIPVAEDLNLPFLSESIKDAYFKYYYTEVYRRIERWMEYVFWLDTPGAKAHLENIMRLIQEVGKTTGGLPDGASIAGRVKIPYSVQEKLLSEPTGLSYIAGWRDLLVRKIMGVPKDIFAIKIRVNKISEIYRVAKMLGQLFRGVNEALEKLEKERRHRINGDIRMDDDYLARRGANVKDNIVLCLRAVSEHMRRDLYRKGYRHGVKDGLRNRSARVPYYSMILTSYANVPFEVMITTFDLDKKVDESKPHWIYKLMKQLKIYREVESSAVRSKPKRARLYELAANLDIGRIRGGINEGDLELRKDGVYAVVIDKRRSKARFKFIPSRSFSRYEKAFGLKPGELQNGIILEKPERKAKRETPVNIQF